jgi:NADPH-dependent 2,4-dienoyl-CoA reductase/sulfur reductase-like enzyme/nitrite reductase/ring-hydroxylating ferredoxin subunit
MAQGEYEVGTLGDMDGAGMRQVEVEGTSILLVGEADQVYAIGATCPHAGGPLAKGVRNGDRVVCPWHKATFCIRTGNILEPPAVDALPRFKVRLDGQRIFVTLPAESPPQAEPPADDRCFVIVGAGAAGAVAAQTLREVGFAGRIVMLDAANRVPYDRTVLSKYHLSGETGGEKSPLQAQRFYEQRRIERRTACVTGVDVRQRRIACADGFSLRYDSALLAMGGVPKRPDLPGANLANVFLLRSRADADAILAQAERSRRAAVLGASFIGMEVAASLRERGLEVTVVGSENVPFEKQLGGRIGSAFLSLHRRRGVAFRLGHRVAALHGSSEVDGVTLESGETIPADLVVLGFGVTPATSWLHDLKLNEDGGVPVDAQLRAAEGLYAAGDIASFPHRGDGKSIRVEHWRVAQQHGRVAARNMAGQPVRYDAVPVFWTIQYLKRLDYIGHASSWDEVVVHGDLKAPKFLAYYVKDGKVAAAVGLDRDQDTAALVELFTQRREWTAAELGDRPASLLASGRFG